MGIYDRDYARAPWGAGSNLAGWTWTRILIVANVSVFLVQAFAEGFLVRWLALHPEDLLERGFVWQLASYTFLHDGLNIFHLFFNMLFLYWFGTELEEAYGARRFMGLYLTSGAFGGLSQVAAWRLLDSPGRYLVGASACVMGVLIACTFRDPKRPMYLFLVPVPVQLRFLALVYVAADLLGLARSGGGVGYAAHLGGALWGGLWWFYQEKGIRLPGWRPGRKRHLKLVESGRPHGPAPEVRAEVDRLLAKISSAGIDALTASEKDYLARASREFRNH